MNEQFEKKIKAKDSTQQKWVLVFVLDIAFAIALMIFKIEADFLFWIIFPVGVISFIAMAVTGRSIAEDVAYNTEKAKEK